MIAVEQLAELDRRTGADQYREPSTLIGWTGFAVAVVLAASGVVAALVRYRMAGAVVALVCLAFTAGGWLPHRGLQANLTAALDRLGVYDQARAHGDLVEVGRVTDLVAAEKALAWALLYAWGAGDPTPKDLADAHQTARFMLTSLHEQQCMVQVPRKRGAGHVEAWADLGEIGRWF